MNIEHPPQKVVGQITKEHLQRISNNISVSQTNQLLTH